MSADRPASGKVARLNARSAAREFVTTGAGQFLAHQLDTRRLDGQAQWWLESKLWIPVRGHLGGLGEVTLEELSVGGSASRRVGE